MDAELIALVAGILLSLAFSYIPGLNTKYAAQTEEVKKLIMIGVLALVAFGAYGLACANWLEDLTGIVITCDKAGFIGVVQVFVLAAIGNQTTYGLTVKTKKVKAAKAGG
jgi:hypothetical protein